MSAKLEMTGINEIVMFSLDEPIYALPLASVVRVIRAVEITPLPKTPEIVMGVINMQGEVIPVIDIRRRFGLSAHEIRLEDRLIIAATARRLVALVVDSVEGVRKLENRVLAITKENLPVAEYIEGVVNLEQGLFMILDLDRFLSLDEEKILDSAITKSKRGSDE